MLQRCPRKVQRFLGTICRVKSIITESFEIYKEYYNIEFGNNHLHTKSIVTGSLQMFTYTAASKHNIHTYVKLICITMNRPIAIIHLSHDMAMC